MQDLFSDALFGSCLGSRGVWLRYYLCIHHPAVIREMDVSLKSAELLSHAPHSGT